MFGQVRPGFELVAINGQPVLDSIDFRYRTGDEEGTIGFVDQSGEQVEFAFGRPGTAGLGLRLADDPIRRCNCKCVFCFVDQQPKGLRRSLYVKDEDYRLSFTHGNFVTLSNVSEKDFHRIIEQRLSPLYVSVHTTDDTLRRAMLGNKKLDSIVRQLSRLTDSGITVHSQVVLCPGINDGSHLERTVTDLARLYPGVATLAIVPVGLTRYRAGLPALRPITPLEAISVLEYVERAQRGFFGDLGTRFVWLADELYVLANRDFPSRNTYEEMSQFENGVGMGRELLTVFNRRRAGLGRLRSDRRVVLLTGHCAYPFLKRHVLRYLVSRLGWRVSLLPVPNRFWGHSVTVSGLLAGQDLLEAAQARAGQCDVVVLPPNCLNSDRLFLDDMSLEQFQDRLQRPVVVGHYDLVQTFRDAFQ